MSKLLVQPFALLVFATVFGLLNVASSASPCQDWVAYKDEKCFRILDATFRTFDEAEKACNALDDTSKLPIIGSKEEQEFLVNYLFKTSKRVDNFWLGAKFTTTFHWNDNTELKFTNWDKDGPHQKVNYCVQMQSDESRLGKWIDEPCERKNVVVCQRMQTWSNALLQKTLLEARKELRNSIDEANKKIIQTNEESNMKIAQTHEESNKKIVELEQSITDLKQNPVPIGFIYVQLSTQADPKSLWPAVEWNDVTSEYAGLFFRAEGAGSGQFGTVQNENAPRVTEVRIFDFPSISELPGNTYLKPGEWSSGKGVYSGSYYGQSHKAHQFFQTGGEVRPRNSAIRVWKRTK